VICRLTCWEIPRTGRDSKNGTRVISNFRDRFSNSSFAWMEWVADWRLVYRAEGEFRKIFLDMGFSAKDVKIFPQQSKVMQYCFTNNN